MSAPPRVGATIDASDVSDCVSPSTMPCSLRSTRWVTRAVSAGRNTALPTEASVAATTRPGSVDTPPSTTYPTPIVPRPQVTMRDSPQRFTMRPMSPPCRISPTKPA
jgi:hypothetical protein